MTRRLQTCTRCGGKTRHADHRCSRCRLGTPVLTLVHSIADIHAPTVAELAAGTPIGHLIEGYSFAGGRIESFTWHGTDCSCLPCRRDRIPGRHA